MEKLGHYCNVICWPVWNGYIGLTVHWAWAFGLVCMSPNVRKKEEVLRKMYYMALVMYYTYESWHERRWWSGSGQPDALPHPSAVDQVRAQSLEENEAVLTIFTLTSFPNTFQILSKTTHEHATEWFMTKTLTQLTGDCTRRQKMIFSTPSLGASGSIIF